MAVTYIQMKVLSECVCPFMLSEQQYFYLKRGRLITPHGMSYRGGEDKIASRSDNNSRI